MEWLLFSIYVLSPVIMRVFSPDSYLQLSTAIQKLSKGISQEYCTVSSVLATSDNQLCESYFYNIRLYCNNFFISSAMDTLTLHRKVTSLLQASSHDVCSLVLFLFFFCNIKFEKFYLTIYCTWQYWPFKKWTSTLKTVLVFMLSENKNTLTGWLHIFVKQLVQNNCMP